MSKSSADDNKTTETTRPISTIFSAAVGISILILFLPFQYLWPCSLLPFMLLCLHDGMDASIIAGILLSIIWTSYLLLLYSPFYFILGRFFMLAIYSPLFVIFIKAPKNSSAMLWLWMWLQTFLWDWPLIWWVHICSFVGVRALSPLYSEINNDVAMGSMPLDSDVKYLVSQGIGAVINMCREYPGPIAAYDKHGIVQLRLPTPDVCEPNLMHLIEGVRFIKHFKSQNRNKKIFIHCKGGRARAATMAMCYLLNEGKTKNAAAKLLLLKRPVVEASTILRYSVVQGFEDYIRLHQIS